MEEARERFERESAAIICPDKYWRMGTGELIAIATMDNQHLLNAIRFTRRNAPATEEQLQQWPPFKGLLKEARRRKLIK